MKSPQRQARGFSLVEVLVAIAILGISLGMIYQAAGGSVRSVSTTEDYAYAVELAQSLLAINSTVTVDGANSAGQTDDGYHWSVTSQVAAVNDEDIPVLYSVVVSVRWGDLRYPREFLLTSMAPVRMEQDAR